MLKSLIVRGRVRFLCAVLGVAAAVGAVVFTFSLAASNTAQAPALAARLLAEVPAHAGAPSARLGIDYRPGGRVMQGRPMQVVAVRDDSLTGGVVVTRALFAQRELPAPPVGAELTLVGEKGSYKVRIGRVLDWEKPVQGYPNLFLGGETARLLGGETWRPLPSVSVAELAPRLVSDEGRRMDYARPLLLAAAILTALCLLVNSLLLSVESNRRLLAVLRTVGLTRGGVLSLVVGESFCATLTGWLVGCLGAVGSLALWVAADRAAFPSGMAVSGRTMAVSLVCAFAVAAFAVLLALRPALSVRPLDAFETRPDRRRHGMAIAFACGFGAFVAVEVWGASLMRGFVPSKEWPDAIVSILPEGVSSFDIGKVRKIPGVRRISELVPLQLDCYPVEPMRGPGGAVSAGGPGGPRGGIRPQNRNALLLAAEWLPSFRFLEGSREEAQKAIASSDACVITEMMSRARGLHKGDRLDLVLPGRGPVQSVGLPVAAVVDLNWHMVTSRGLVRGLNGAPVMTDGPVFVSFDTLEALDPRPAAHVKMTHLWLDYDPAFLKAKGVFPAGREVEKAIARAFGFNPNQAESAATVRLHARDEVADGTLAHGLDVIGQVARVPFVFLAILAIGFVAMLVADAEATRHALVVLRAVGATRLQLTRRLAAGALKTALRGVLAGLPVGALTGWLFSLGTAGVWPGMPRYFVVPVRVICEGACGAVLFALLFALPAAYCLIRRLTRR